MDNNQSFEDVTKWIEELWRHSEKGIIPVVLLGTRQDWSTSQVIPTEKIERYTRALSE